MTKNEIIAESSKEPGGMFMVIPVVVKDDPAKLPKSAWLLYGDITWRCNDKQRCWPTNRQLAEDLDLSPKRISVLLSLLEKCGHIETELILDTDTGEVLRRYIYPIVKSGRGILTNRDTPPQEEAEPLPENAEDKYKAKRKEIPPKAPQGGRRTGREPKSEPAWKPERFKRFWDFYSHKARGENKQAAIRAWDKLKPDDALIDEMATALSRKVESKDWREGIGIPYASTWLNNRRWEDPTPADRSPDSGGTVRVVERGDLPVW